MTKEELVSMTMEEIEDRLTEAVNRGHMNFLAQLSTPSDAPLIVYAEELKLRENGVMSDDLI